MKKITFSFIALFLTSLFFGQTYSTGTLNLNAINGNSLNYSAKIDVTSSLVTLTLIGPATGWLAIGFNNTTMANSGDVVLFDGTALTDRTFNGFAATPVLDAQQDWTLVTNTVSSGVRTVVGTRARVTGDATDYVFSATAQSLNLVYARKVSNFDVSYHGSNSCGTVLSSITLGNEKFKIDEFKLYPNPARDFVSFSLPSEVAQGTVKIYDMLGKVVITQLITPNENSIGISKLTSGSYLVVLRTEYGNATKTLLVN